MHRSVRRHAAETIGGPNVHSSSIIVGPGLRVRQLICIDRRLLGCYQAASASALLLYAVDVAICRPVGGRVGLATTVAG